MQAIRAAAFIAAHTIIAALLIISIYGVHILNGWLWGEENPLMFNFLPVKYVFDAIELSVLLVFGYRGFRAANIVFEHKE